VEIQIGFGPLKRRLSFAAGDVKQFSTRRVLFEIGVQLEHEKPDYPPYIVFWTSRHRRLLAAARAAGYVVVE
jgi:hypothetical protein